MMGLPCMLLTVFQCILLHEYANAEECYKQALLDSYQIDIEMTQMMIQLAIKNKLGELELLKQN